MISTAYVLPFPVWYSERVFSSGSPVQIRVRVAHSRDVVPLKSVIQTFASLAATGALSGKHLAPWDTALRLNHVPSQIDNELIFQADDCYLADEALIVLIHMLLASHKTAPVEVVEVVTPEREDRQKLESRPNAESTYPGVFSNLPFTVDDLEPEGGGYTFFIELQLPVEPSSEQQLNAAFGAWIRSILMGGYSLAPIDPCDSYVEPDSEEVTSYGTNIEWAVFKLHADPEAALAAVLNILAAFHMRCQKIERLEIG